MLIDYFNDEIKQIKEKFFQRIKHPYLKKFLNDPILDDDRLFILYSMLAEKKVTEKKIKDYIITTLLVQAALDTHEIVSTVCVRDDKLKKERQLTVLAGDYYSSLYYYLLAKIDDIPMIRLLANSIQEVNESKMSFYKKNHQNIHQSIHDIKIIESSLMQKVADHLKLPFCKAVVSEYFYFKRLITERQLLLEGKKVPLIDSIVNEDPSPVVRSQKVDYLLHAAELCEKYIQESKENLLSLCEQPTPLSSFIMNRMDQLLLETGLLKEKVVEEG